MSQEDPSPRDLLAAHLATSARVSQLAAQLQGRSLSLERALDEARSAWETSRSRLAPGIAPEAPPEPAPPASVVAGMTLDDKYRVDEVVSRSGTDVTWGAEEVRTGRRVLVTVLSDVAGDAARQVAGRLRQEVGVQARGDHPNVARILDAGLAGDALYLVLEELRGRSLRHRIVARGGLPRDEALDLLLQVAAGLHAIHAAGVVHGDVRPENIVLVDNKVKIVGFWPALMERYGRPYARGTPRYASPELQRGEAADTRSDLYALGVTAYEALTGSAPHPPTLTRGSSAPRPLPPRVPVAVGEVVLKALAREPSERWDTAEAFGTALRRAWDPFAG